MKNPRPRLTFVIDKIAGRSGGAERILIERANYFANKGHIVHIVTHEGRQGPPFYPIENGVTHKNLKKPNSGRSSYERLSDTIRGWMSHAKIFPPILNQIFWNARHRPFVRRLSEYIDAHQPDIIISFLPPAITAGAAQKPNKRIYKIASIHNVPYHDFADPERWDPNPVDQRFRLQGLRTFDQVTVLIPEFRGWFEKKVQNRITILPNPVPPVAARSQNHPKDFLEKKIILGVGRLAKVKRFDILIDAWDLISDKHPDWELHIYGEGPLQSELQKRRQNLQDPSSLSLKGQTKEIIKKYQSAKIVAHTAEFEGWGLTVSEALSCGVPCIAFADCSGANFLIKDRENGILVPPGADRVSAFACALSDLINDNRLRSLLSEKGPGSVEAFRPEAVDAIWDRMIEQAISQKME